MSVEEGPAAAARPFRAAGFRGDAVDGFDAILRAHLLPRPEECVRQGRILRESNHRVTARVEAPGVGGLLLKVHRARSRTERLLSFWRASRARNEWDAARHLGALGLPVPAALAVGEQRRAGMVETAFYVARFLEDFEALSGAWPSVTQARPLLDRTAVLVRALHDGGFDHLDLHTGNVLRGPGDAAACRLVVTDLHRSRRGRVVGARARRRAAAQWLHSLRDVIGAAGRLRWWARYAPEAPPGARRRAFARIERRIARLERVRLRSRGKRCFRESTVYTRVRSPGRGWSRRDLDPERIAAALAAHESAGRAGAAGFVKRSRKGLVTRHGGLVVKERRSRRALDRLRDRLHPARHASGYRNAHRLAVRGLGTARPLAFLRRDGRVLSLFEDLSACPRLDHRLRAVFEGADLAARARLLRATADWLRRLHALGVYHGDLKGVNVLVDETGRAPVFRLIDTDRCRFLPRPVGRRRRIKNLAQLAASIPRCVSRTDRLRFFRRYAEGSPLAAEDKRTARSVAAHLARKIVVVDEPIE